MDKLNGPAFDWVQDVVLEDGEEWSTSTSQGPLRLRLENGVLSQTRTDPETDEEIQQTFILESLQRRGQVRFDFLPLYPDRPIVFSIDDPLSIPTGQNGFFCLTFYVEIGIKLQSPETVLERILPEPRKNSYWGPPQGGLLTYRETSKLHTDPIDVMKTTNTTTAVLPVYYQNRREEGGTVDRCLVPLDELDLYRNQNNDLIFEVVRLRQLEEFYQEPQPLKRPPREMDQEVTHFLNAPSQAKSLFDTVKGLPRLDQISNMFLNR